MLKLIGRKLYTMMMAIGQNMRKKKGNWMGNTYGFGMMVGERKWNIGMENSMVDLENTTKKEQLIHNMWVKMVMKLKGLYDDHFMNKQIYSSSVISFSPLPLQCSITPSTISQHKSSLNSTSCSSSLWASTSSFLFLSSYLKIYRRFCSRYTLAFSLK